MNEPAASNSGAKTASAICPAMKANATGKDLESLWAPLSRHAARRDRSCLRLWVASEKWPLSAAKCLPGMSTKRLMPERLAVA